MDTEHFYWTQELECLLRENIILRGMFVSILSHSQDPTVWCLARKAVAELRAIGAGGSGKDLDAILREFDLTIKGDK